MHPANAVHRARVSRAAKAAWFLLVLVGAAARPARADEVTFNRDVAPILFSRCAACHRPGAVAPFSLLTYRDARQRMALIADATRRRLMPPWKPVPGSNDFLDDRSLTPPQLATIQAWVAGGGREGNRADLPAAPRFTSGWQLGPPDLVVTMPAPFTVRSDGPDVFRTFVLPVPLDRTRYVRAIEFQPGNARVVHHANMGVDRTKSSSRLDAADEEPGYEGGMVPDAGYPPGYLLGWTPGQQARPSPEGMAWRLEPGSDFIAQLHLQPTGKPELLQVRVGFYFTDTAPAATPVGLRLGSQTIDIPPGDASYEISDRFTVPVDVDLLAVQPHMHNLGRTVRAEALLADGAVTTLMAIDDWDFRWQDVYRYRHPIRLPRGTVLSMRMMYDNSAANPRNPSRPPRRMVWGQNTSDEMGDVWLQMVPVAGGDLAQLTRAVQQKSSADDLEAYTKILRSDPDNPLRHDAVGMLDLQAGRFGPAADHFRESLRLNPDSAPTHYNLGLTLALMRQYADAQRELDEAVRLDPSHAQAHNNLGVVLQQMGRLPDAAAEYRRATALNPDNVEAHNNLGRILMAGHGYAEASAVLQRALAINPDYVAALSALSWLRSSAAVDEARDPDAALRLAMRAVALSGRQDAAALDALAAALAAAGQWDEAVRAGNEALRLAEQVGLAALADEIRARLAQYRRREPYRLP